MGKAKRWGENEPLKQGLAGLATVVVGDKGHNGVETFRRGTKDGALTFRERREARDILFLKGKMKRTTRGVNGKTTGTGGQKRQEGNHPWGLLIGRAGKYLVKGRIKKESGVVVRKRIDRR